MNKIAVLVVVAVALGGVVWMKSQATEGATPTPPEETAASAEAPEQASEASVLLFADPREAEARCGCAEIIRLARGAGDIAGVAVREFDTRQSTAEGKRYRVLVSPTVIITDSEGTERTRFEGESQDVIAKLSDALSSLEGEPSQGKATDR